jgi:hypothetical protein
MTNIDTQETDYSVYPRPRIFTCLENNAKCDDKFQIN